MWTQGDTTPPGEAGPVQAFVEQLLAQHPWPWREESYDMFTFQAAKEYLVRKKPRVFYVNFGENDEWAHAGRYDHYLTSIVNVDRFIRELWETAQALPEYRGTTTLILTTDHGRGAGLASWKTHGESVPESREWWVAALGPDTPALGERENAGVMTQAQIAATIAKFVGEDFRAAVPEAAEPIADFFR
jgi:phosphopentomutase